MTTTAYVFEKACYSLDALAVLSEDVRRLEPSSQAQRDVSCHVQVAVRYALQTLSRVVRSEFEPTWVIRLMREGRPAWEQAVKPALDAALFGPPTGSPAEAAGLPRDFSSSADEPDLNEADVIGPALRVVAALLDLGEAVCRHGVETAEGTTFERQLVWAFNGATKVVSTLLAAEWETSWPQALARQGRAALAPVIDAWAARAEPRKVKRADLGPLDEAWLTDADPVRSPDVDQALERQRRAEVLRDTRLAGDLIVPARYQGARLERLAESGVPEHQAAVAFAKNPSGVLLLKGEFRSALHAIQFAIGRHWFVDALETVRDLRWHDLVESNLMAQTRAHWDVRRLLLRDLMPVLLEGGGTADPGYADKLLAHRLEKGLPTVVTYEYGDLGIAGLSGVTRERLEAARTVALPNLEDREAERLGLEF